MPIDGNPARIHRAEDVIMEWLAERMNRTIMERVQSMLAHGKLSKKFSAEALMTMAYVINKSP